MHDLHIWALSSGKVALTAHVEVEAGLAREDRLENALGSMLKARFGTTRATVQAELPGSHGGRDPHAAWPAGAEGAHEHGCADGDHGHGHGCPSRRVPRG